MKVPHRQGWTLGEPVNGRVSVYHAESAFGLRVSGHTHEERVRAAQTAIDAEYEHRWAALSDVIELGDWRGPNVRRLESPRGGPPTS